MKPVVLAASALLALLNNEQGAELVQSLLPVAVISTVTLAEVVTKLSAVGMPESGIRECLALLGLETASIDVDTAFQAGLLSQASGSCELTPSDRACLALALQRDATVVTADRMWKELGIPAVSVMLIR